MVKIDMEAIRKLTVAERLALVEEIWDSISDDAGSMPTSERQLAEARRRLAEHDADPSPPSHGMRPRRYSGAPEDDVIGHRLLPRATRSSGMVTASALMIRYRVLAVEARPDYRLWVRFEDGVEGEADLSDIAGSGVFKRWKEHPDEFVQVEIDPVSGAPTWPGDLDVAPDRLHSELAAAAHLEP